MYRSLEGRVQVGEEGGTVGGGAKSEHATLGHRAFNIVVTEHDVLLEHLDGIDLVCADAGGHDDLGMNTRSQFRYCGNAKGNSFGTAVAHGNTLPKDPRPNTFKNLKSAADSLGIAPGVAALAGAAAGAAAGVGVTAGLGAAGAVVVVAVAPAAGEAAAGGW